MGIDRPFCTRKYVYVVQNCTFVSKLLRHSIDPEPLDLLVNPRINPGKYQHFINVWKVKILHVNCSITLMAQNKDREGHMETTIQLSY
jgi:hypothetical protein